MPAIYKNELTPMLWGSAGNVRPQSSTSGTGAGNIGGNVGELQYNADGVLGGVADTSYDANIGVLNLGNVSNLKIGGGVPGQVLTVNNVGNITWATSGSLSQPQIHFIAPVSGQNQSFADTALETFQSSEWAGVFRNGVLMPSDQYIIQGGVLSIATQLFANDRIDVLQTTSGSNVSGNIGNVNLNGVATNFLDGTGNWSSVLVPTYGTVANLNLNGNIAQYLRGDGQWANVPVAGGNIQNINLNGNTVQYLRGDGSWTNIAVPTGNIANTNYNGNAATYLNGQGSWVTVQSGGIPGGTNSQVQFNENGVFGGMANVTFDGNAMVVGGNANIKIGGGTANGILKTDGNGNLSWANLVNYSAVPRMEFQVTSAGNNQSFTNANLAAYPSSSYATVFRNGVLMDPTDYTITGTIIQFPINLEIGESIDIVATATTGGSAGGGGTGTVSNVLTAGSGLGFSLSGGPITTTGTITLSTPNATSLRTSLDIGNVANANFNGNGNSYLRGNGTFGQISAVAGNTTEIQYNLNGVLTATNNMRYDTANNVVTFEGVTNLLDRVVVEGNITPFTTNTFTLGNSTHRWKDVFLSSNSIIVGDTTLSSDANGMSINGNVAVTAPNNTITVGNIVANLFTGNAANLTNINGSNVSKVGSAGSADVALSVALANITGIGNIANLNLNGNVSQVLSGNGTWVTNSTAAGGLDGQIQVNSNNNFAGYANFTFNSTFGAVTAPRFWAVTEVLVPSIGTTAITSTARILNLAAGGTGTGSGNITISTTGNAATDGGNIILQSSFTSGTSNIYIGNSIQTSINRSRTTITGDLVFNTPIPATASSSGVAGQTAVGGGYIYVCVATDTWQRASLSTW